MMEEGKVKNKIFNLIKEITKNKQIYLSISTYTNCTTKLYKCNFFMI